MCIIFLICIPVLLGLCAGLALWPANELPVHTQEALSWVGGIAFVFLVCNYLASLLSEEGESSTEGKLLHPWKADITDAEEAQLPDGRSVIRARGRYFVFASHKDGATVQEYNKHGTPISAQVTSDSSAWRFGKSPEQDIAEYTKAKINRGESLPREGKR